MSLKAFHRWNSAQASFLYATEQQGCDGSSDALYDTYKTNALNLLDTNCTNYSFINCVWEGYTGNLDWDSYHIVEKIKF